MATRTAQLIASSVSVCCPYCGEPQPDPDHGSDMWTADQIDQHAGVVTCPACEAKVAVVLRRTATLEPVGAVG